MSTQSLIEGINLIAEAGDASDALDLVRTLTREGNTTRAVQIRRTVTGGRLDRNALRAVARDIARAAAESAALLTPQAIESLYALEAALREGARQRATMSAAAVRAESAARWTAGQRYDERVAAHNQAVEKVNRARGLAANKRQAAAVRAETCEGCFQVPAANGSCGC